MTPAPVENSVGLLRSSLAVFGVVLSVLVGVTLWHYGRLYRKGKETSPPWSVYLLRLSHLLAVLYVCGDMVSRQVRRDPVSGWRMPLFTLVLLTGLPGTIGVLWYVKHADWRYPKPTPKAKP